MFCGETSLMQISAKVMEIKMTYVCCCRGHLLGQSFVSSGWGRCLLQDEDHSGSRPHSFPGSCYMRSGTSAEQFRSGPELAGSWESHQDLITRLVWGFSSYWTLETISLWLFPELPQRLELYSVAAHLRGMRPTPSSKNDTLTLRENSNF